MKLLTQRLISVNGSIVVGQTTTEKETRVLILASFFVRPHWKTLHPTTLTAIVRGRFRPDVASLHRWRRSGRRSTARNDPDIDAVLLTETSVGQNDPRSIDLTLTDEIVSGSRQKVISPSDGTGPAAIGKQIGRRCRVIL